MVTQTGCSDPELFDRDRLITLRDEIASFVHRECDAQRAKFSRLWKKPVEVRIESGGCISDLQIDRVVENRLIRFRCQVNHSDFREGDRVRISRGDPNSPLAEGEYYREESGFIEILVDGAWNVPDQGGVFTLDRSFIDLEDQYRRSIERLGETEIGRNRILPLLGGDKNPVLDLEESEQVHQLSKDRGLNDGQAEAIAGATATDLCYLIQGPPGTGKTHVLAEVVRNRLSKGERILVTSFTHRAIHNALNRISAACPPDTDICKIGRKVHDPGLKVEQFESFGQAPCSGSGGAFVVGATPFTAQSQRLNQVEFDTVIFDEAGQITLPLAVMGMLSGRTYIFVGDHKQLPPVLHSASSREEAQSIFSYLRGRGFEEVLDVTYRMNSRIASWPSEQFYLGSLVPHERVAARKIQYPLKGHAFEEILTPDHPSVFVQMPEGEDKTSSVEEAVLMGHLLQELVKTRGFPATEIGVVVPFRKQARVIRQRLQVNGRADPAFADLVVDTVERMQGQERELVIVGMTASDPEFIGKVHGFLFQPNRLNVCFTRSRSKLIVLGSSTLLTAPPDFIDTEEWKEGRGLFQSFVAAAKPVVWT